MRKKYRTGRERGPMIDTEGKEIPEAHIDLKLRIVGASPQAAYFEMMRMFDADKIFLADEDVAQRLVVALNLLVDHKLINKVIDVIEEDWRAKGKNISLRELNTSFQAQRDRASF